MSTPRRIASVLCEHGTGETLCQTGLRAGKIDPCGERLEFGTRRIVPPLRSLADGIRNGVGLIGREAGTG